MQIACLCDAVGTPVHQLPLLTLPAVIVYWGRGEDGVSTWSRFQDNEYRQVTFQIVEAD